MTIAKDQHILPQMYLKHFVDPDTPPGMEPYVWRYDLAEQRWQRRAPKKVARKRYYYAFQNKNNQLVNTLEPRLSPIESRGATLIRKLASRTSLTEREAQDFSLFIAQLMFRTPQSRVATASWLDRKCQEFVAGQIQHWRENPEEFEEVVRRDRDKSGKRVDITIEDVERSKPKLEPRDGTLLGYSMMPTIGLAARLLMMSWRIFFTHAEHWLIISDHPCELGWPDEMTEDEITEETFRGFCIKGIEFHVPLTPNMLFTAFDDGPSCTFGEFFGRELVVQLNQHMAARAEEFIVSPKPSFLGDDVLTRVGRQT
jgi:Protein of unknown function (DUF4238)